MNMGAVWKSMFTPRLIKVYGNRPAEKIYEASALESLGDSVIKSLYIIMKLGVYTTPFIVTYLYRRSYFEIEGCITLTKIASLIGGMLVISYCIRGIGRANNQMYQRFISTLEEAQNNLTPTAKQHLSAYDFEFYAWPVEFKWSDVQRDDAKSRIFLNDSKFNRSILQFGTSLPCQIIGYIAVHTFGIRLVYPGSIGLLQSVLAEGLLQGRSKLIEVNNGLRSKLEAKDGNAIDVMFVDKRNTSNANGNILVICCEGNAGFYEIGIMCTPIVAGYSVLGWNHPGFGGSTGTPYPEQELNAMDVVMLYATTKLGYRMENIVLFGWSIGGYSSSWAAMNYPEIKGIILDASFDDIMPLAINHMPSWSESIVRLAIRAYINLNNVEQLSKYSGPVLLIRRTEDEVICTTMGDTSTNRGNNLLIKILKQRFPLLYGDVQLQALEEYLALGSPSSQDQFILRHNVKKEICKEHLESYISEFTDSYPIKIGEQLTEELKTQIGLYVARKYMKDYKATHCAPLPTDMFQMPWNISADNDFVFT